MGYGVFYFRSNGLKIRRSNGFYFGAQTSNFFRSNVLRRFHCSINDLNIHYVFVASNVILNRIDQ